MIKNDPEFAAEIEEKIKSKRAELEAESTQKYRPSAAPMAMTEDEEKSEVKNTRAAARAKLDIAVEDDED